MRDFNKEAAQWDTPPRVKLAEDIAREICRVIPVKPDMDILDFGCGTGLLSLALRSKARSMTGMDTAAGMLEVFEAKIATQKIAGARTLLIDSRKGLAIPGKYHLIVSSMTLHHVKDLEPLFRCFYEALLPGGYLALADLDPEQGFFHESPEGVFSNGFEHDALAKMLGAAGFKEVDFYQAAQITKPVQGKEPRAFTVFLATSVKRQL